MAVSRAKKIEQVEKLGKELKNVSSMIVATYSKLKVAQDYELRKTLRSSGAKYVVVKNTLAELAAKGTKVEEALKNLSGVTSIAYTSGDPVALADAVSRMLSMREHWPRIRHAGRQFVERERNWAASVSRYGPIYERRAASRSGH